MEDNPFAALLPNINQTLKNGAKVEIAIDSLSATYIAIAIFAAFFTAYLLANIILKQIR
jgi:hypothetical protein